MNQTLQNKINNWVEKLELGSSTIALNGEKFQVSKKITETSTGKQSVSVQAIRLQDQNLISFNWYPQLKGGTLKPCELPNEVVIQWLEKVGEC